MDDSIDPDNYFFSSSNNDCHYYTDEQYNNINEDIQLSIIHINCRSLYANLTVIANMSPGSSGGKKSLFSIQLLNL